MYSVKIKPMKEQSNYVSVGKMIECGHCHPEKFQAVEPCDCICHEQKQSWKDDISILVAQISRVNGDVGRRVTLEEANELLTHFISQEIQKAYQKGIVDAVKELDELGYNKEAEKKAREEERDKFKKRIEHIAMELDNEPSEGEESVYSWIEGQFPELFNKE